MHFIVVVVRCASCALAFSHRVDLLERVVFGHGVRRGNVLWHAWREDGLEGLDLLWLEWSWVAICVWWPAQAFWELDFELNVKVAEVVVPVGRHTLPADDLDIACASVSIVVAILYPRVLVAYLEK